MLGMFYIAVSIISYNKKDFRIKQIVCIPLNCWSQKGEEC